MQIGKYRKVVRLATVFLLLLSTSLFANLTLPSLRHDNQQSPCDRQGNIHHLVDTQTSQIVTRYTYTPFTGITKNIFDDCTGNPMWLPSNPSRFSKWLKRDPLEERGGINLTPFCQNNPTNLIDPDGRVWNIVIGALLGAGLNIIEQFADRENLDELDWTSIGTSAIMEGATSSVLGKVAGASKILNIGFKSYMGLSAVQNLYSGLSQNLDDINKYGLFSRKGEASVIKTAIAVLPFLVKSKKMVKAKKPVSKVKNLPKKKHHTSSKRTANAPKSGQRLLNPPIKQTPKGMKHVLDRNTVNDISRYASKSKFSVGEDVGQLIRQSTQQPMVCQANGNFARTFDVDRQIGIDRATRQATSTMTVITKPDGTLVTAFPGRP